MGAYQSLKIKQNAEREVILTKREMSYFAENAIFCHCYWHTPLPHVLNIGRGG